MGLAIMESSKDMRVDKTLMHRLHEACRPSYSQSAFALRAKGGGDYMAEPGQRVVSHSTLGASIQVLARKRLSRT